MTVENTVSMDLTTLFKSCMKTIRTRNKAMGVTLPQTKIFPSSSPSSQFYTRANDINKNIISHRSLLRDHQKKYLQDHEQSMTDHERNYMEKVVTTNLRIIDDNIKNVNLDVEIDQGSKDACECRQSILSILRLNFQQINTHFKEMKEKRKKKQKEKDNLFRLHRPASLKKRQSSSSEDSHKTPGLGQVDKKSFSQDTCEGSQPDSLSQSSTDSQDANQENSEELLNVTSKNNEDTAKATNSISTVNNKDPISSSPVEDETENMLGSLSIEERQVLEEENLHMYKELMSNQEEVRQITRQVVGVPVGGSGTETLMIQPAAASVDASTPTGTVTYTTATQVAEPSVSQPVQYTTLGGDVLSLFSQVETSKESAPTEKYTVVAKPLDCSVCAKSFALKRSLWAHMQASHPELYSCAECCAAFTTAEYLNHHKAQHQKLHVCSRCGMAFTSKSSLTRHRQQMHLGTPVSTEEKEKEFACEICRTKFYQQSDLRRHMLGHTGEKPFRCKHCEAGFTRRSSLNKHMRIHTGEKPYVCPVCDQAFAYRYQINRHKIVHKQQEDTSMPYVFVE